MQVLKLSANIELALWNWKKFVHSSFANHLVMCLLRWMPFLFLTLTKHVHLFFLPFIFLMCFIDDSVLLTADGQYEGKMTKNKNHKQPHWALLVCLCFSLFRTFLKFYTLSVIRLFITIKIQLCLFLLWSFNYSLSLLIIL